MRDFAAHVALSHTGLGAATLALARAGGSFSRMIHDTAVRHAAVPVEQLVVETRALAGSRRHAVGTTYLEPLLDVLVHGQDVALPLGRIRPMPLEAAATAATRVWTMGWPFHAKRKLRGLRLTATDVSWSAGQGAYVEGPIAAILLLPTGRRAALAQLSGEGAAELPARRHSVRPDRPPLLVWRYQASGHRGMVTHSRGAERRGRSARCSKGMQPGQGHDDLVPLIEQLSNPGWTEVVDQLRQD